MDMIKPDYHGGSIVNLMGSIIQGFGGQSDYCPTPLLPTTTVAKARHVVLMVIDGLGFNYLQQRPGVLKSHTVGHLSSVFPSSTAPAITSFVTGTAPRQHGVTGWYMSLRELGTVAMILPYKARCFSNAFNANYLPIAELLAQGSLLDQLSVPSHYLMHQHLVDSNYSRFASGRARRREYLNLSDFFQGISDVVQKQRGRSYLYAYWPMFDALAHRFGVASDTVSDHFEHLEQAMGQCLEELAGTNTLLLITADHGFIDTSRSRIIWLEDHPRLAECLTQPLCGEPRVAYCYVSPRKARQFEDYVRHELAAVCELYPSEELLEQGWFGLGNTAACTPARIGDYTLICKENYVIKDTLPTEKRWSDIGVHGGVSSDEMLVPLIVCQP